MVEQCAVRGMILGWSCIDVFLRCSDVHENTYKNISVHIYTCIHMVYTKSSESKGTLVLSIVHKLGRMESLTV